MFIASLTDSDIGGTSQERLNNPFIFSGTPIGKIEIEEEKRMREREVRNLELQFQLKKQSDIFKTCSNAQTLICLIRNAKEQKKKKKFKRNKSQANLNWKM